MASDEDNNDYEHIFPKSAVGSLIARISKMLRNPVIDSALEETLDNFLDRLNETQQYLSHGIFNVKFAEAGLFLQNAVTLYGKKVDLLWDSTLQYQMQLCSYTKSTEENLEETTKIEQRLNRNKRKKLPVQVDDVDINTSLYGDLSFVCDQAKEFLNRRCASVQHSESNQNNVLLSNFSSCAPSAQVLNEEHCKVTCGFPFPVNCPVNNIQTGEKLCNYSDLYLNCAVPILETADMPEIQRDPSGGSECSMTCRKNDWLLQRYVTERHLTIKRFWAHMLGDDFETFKRAHQQEVCSVQANIRLSLSERARSLCPKDFVVNLTRLPDELMSEYIKSNAGHVRELIHGVLARENQIETMVPVNPVTDAIKKGLEGISDADSLFHEEPFDDTEDATTLPENCDTIILTQRSSADSGICCSESAALSGIIEPCDDVNVQEDLANNNCSDADAAGHLQVLEQPNVNGELGTDSFLDASMEEIVENIGRVEYVVDSVAKLESEEESIITGIQNLCNEKIPAIPAQISVVHRSNLKPLEDSKIEKQSLKRKLQKEQDLQNKTEKRRKSQPRFRWLKTTTTTLKTFERFFRKNYQPEFGEASGDVPEDDSDDEMDVVLPDEMNLENFEVENEEAITTTDLHTVPNTTAEVALEDSTGQPIQECISSVTDAEPPDDSISRNFDDEEVHNNNVTVQTSSVVCDSVEVNRDDSGDATDAINSASCIDESANSASSATEINIANMPMFRAMNSEIESIGRLKAVTEWRRFMEPKLQMAERNSKFDIHEYGTRIMDAIPEESNLNFKDLADGKPPSEVARLFLASLQLANTYNVELVAPSQGKLVNDELEIKLLTRERYHEHLDEYEAPSEYSFRERLAQVQALQSSTFVHSTPKSVGAKYKAKRRKLS